MAANLTPPILTEALSSNPPGIACAPPVADPSDPWSVESAEVEAAEIDSSPIPRQDAVPPQPAGRTDRSRPDPARGFAAGGTEPRQRATRRSAQGDTAEQLRRRLAIRERELGADLERTRQELEASRREVASLLGRQEEQNRALARLEQRQLSQLRDLQLEKQEQETRLNAILRGLQEELASSHQQLQAQAAELSELEELRQERQAWLGREQALQEQRSRLEDQVLRLRISKRAMKAQLRRAEEERKASRREGAALRLQHEEQGNALIQLEQRHLSHLEEWRQERQAGSSREQALQGQLDQARLELAAALDRQQALESDHLRERSRLEEELGDIQQLLEDLPEIYETKFRQRLQPLLDQRNWLLEDNAQLRGLLRPATSAAATGPGEPTRELPQLPAPEPPQDQLHAQFQFEFPGDDSHAAVE